MRKRDTTPPKHVHRWKIVKRNDAWTGGYDWFGTGAWVDAHPLQLTRQCDDCGVKQSAEVPNESVLVPGYEAVGDVEWK